MIKRIICAIFGCSGFIDHCDKFRYFECKRCLMLEKLEHLND